MTPDEEQKSGRDAYWRAREEADAERGGAPDVISGGVDEPDDEPAKSPFATAFEKAALGRAPSDYERPDEPAAGFDPAPYSPSTPAPSGAQQNAIDTQQAATTPDRSAKYDAALADVHRIAAEPTPGVDIGAVQAGQRSRDQKTAANDFTRAIQAWMFRKPFEPSAPTDAEDALTVQSLKAKQGQADKASRLSAAEMVAKALRGEKQPDMTPYQAAELKRQKDLDAQKPKDRALALEDRKRLLLSQYPEHKTDIEALTDLGNAESLQRTLDSRGTAAVAQAHSDEAATRAQQHSDEMQRRSEAFAREMEAFKATHKTLDAAQSTQLEGLNSADAIIGDFAKHYPDVSGLGSKVAASVSGMPVVGSVAGAMDPKAASFEAERELTASGLVRAIDGSVVRPGTLESIKRLMPHAWDPDAVKAEKTRQLHEYVLTKKEEFARTLKQGGFRPLQDAEDRPAPNVPPQRPKWAPEGSRFVNGKWMYRLPNGKIETAHEE